MLSAGECTRCVAYPNNAGAQRFVRYGRHSAAADVLDDPSGSTPGARPDDVDVAVRVAPDAMTGAEARVAPAGQPLAVEGQDADEAAVVLGDVDDVVGVH